MAKVDMKSMIPQNLPTPNKGQKKQGGLIPPKPPQPPTQKPIKPNN